MIPARGHQRLLRAASASPRAIQPAKWCQRAKREPSGCSRPRLLSSFALGNHLTPDDRTAHSAGAWDSASRRLAIAAVASGRAALTIFDAQSGRKESEVAVPDVDSRLPLDWPMWPAVSFNPDARIDERPGPGNSRPSGLTR